MSEHRTVCIVAGAGRGRRFGVDVPKGFYSIEGKPLLVRSIERVREAGVVDEFVILVPEGWEEEAAALLKEEFPGSDFTVMAGGKTRQQSVAIGLRTVDRAGLVLIHDACRPFISTHLVERVVNAGKETGAAVPVLLVTETLARIRDEMIEGIVPRERVVGIQTPQAFSLEVLKKAYDTAEERIMTATDESSLVLASGHPVKAVEGERWNIKVTVSDDVEIASSFLTGAKLDPEEAGKETGRKDEE